MIALPTKTVYALNPLDVAPKQSVAMTSDFPTFYLFIQLF